MKKAKIEIYQSKKNKNFYFRIIAKNGEKVCQSEGYTTKAMCKKGIKSIVYIITDPETFVYDNGKLILNDLYNI